MFKNRTMQVKWVKDPKPGILSEEVQTEEMIVDPQTVDYVGDTVVRVVEETADVLVRAVGVYMLMDTARKVVINLAAK